MDPTGTWRSGDDERGQRGVGVLGTNLVLYTDEFSTCQEAPNVFHFLT